MLVSQNRLTKQQAGYTFFAQSLSGHNTREEVDDSTVLKTRIELKQVYYNL